MNIGHTHMNNRRAEILEVCLATGNWLERADYRGNDPYQLDHFMARASGTRISRSAVAFFRRLLKPYHALIPKRLFTVAKPILIPQALADSLSAEACLPDGRPNARRIGRLFDLIVEAKSPLASNMGWGLPFRWGGSETHPAHWPVTVATTIVLRAIMDAGGLLDRGIVADVVNSGIRFMIEEIGYEDSAEGICIRYGPGDTRLILNASALAAAVLARAGAEFGRQDWVDLARRAVDFIASHQNGDGSWHYSPAHRGHPLNPTIDSRHTGYIIESLVVANRYLNDARVDAAVSAGWSYVKSNLIEDDRPRWSPETTWPVDCHDLAQGILTALAVKDMKVADRHVALALDTFYLGDGRFAFKLFESGQLNEAVFIRWSQAPMYRALAAYLGEQSLASDLSTPLATGTR